MIVSMATDSFFFSHRFNGIVGIDNVASRSIEHIEHTANLFVRRDKLFCLSPAETGLSRIIVFIKIMLLNTEQSSQKMAFLHESQPQKDFYRTNIDLHVLVKNHYFPIDLEIFPSYL
jgi:hypothetical protein